MSSNDKAPSNDKDPKTKKSPGNNKSPTIRAECKRTGGYRKEKKNCFRLHNMFAGIFRVRLLSFSGKCPQSIYLIAQMHGFFFFFKTPHGNNNNHKKKKPIFFNFITRVKTLVYRYNNNSILFK